MINIRPVSDLRNKFPRNRKNRSWKPVEPVYLTKNGYGSMVVMSIEQYSALTDEVELKLDEADRMADSTDVRYSGDEVFKRVRGRIHGRKAL